MKLFLHILSIIKWYRKDFKNVLLFWIDKLEIRSEIIKLGILGFSILVFQGILQLFEDSELSTSEFEMSLAALSVLIRLFIVLQILQPNFYAIVFFFFSCFMYAQVSLKVAPLQDAIEVLLFGWDAFFREWYIFFFAWDWFIGYLLFVLSVFVYLDDEGRERLLRGAFAGIFYQEPYQGRVIFASFAFYVSFGFPQ